MPEIKITNHKSKIANRTRSPGGLTAAEQTALIDDETCPVCSLPNIIRRGWREDFYCGQCRSVFRMIGERIHYVEHQSKLN